MDLRESNPSDTSDITAARSKEIQIIRSWLCTDDRAKHEHNDICSQNRERKQKYQRGKTLRFQRQGYHERGEVINTKQIFNIRKWLKHQLHENRVIVL